MTDPYTEAAEEIVRRMRDSAWPDQPPLHTTEEELAAIIRNKCEPKPCDPAEAVAKKWIVSGDPGAIRQLAAMIREAYAGVVEERDRLRRHYDAIGGEKDLVEIGLVETASEAK